MQDAFKDKTVPWASLEEYLSLHQSAITTFLDLQKIGILTKPAIEASLPSAFHKLHEAIAKILKDNNILQNEEESKVDQLQLIVKTVMKLQSSLIVSNMNNQEDIKCVIKTMKPEIVSTFGQALQQEVSGLLENLAGMTDIIEANFSQIKDILQQHKDEMIKVITQQNQQEISNLREEVKAKDTQIQNLKTKEGELNGKNEMIASLNRNIDMLKQQLDALTHHGECHDKMNPLQSMVDQLQAKNLELQSELQSLKEKAANELQQLKANFENQPQTSAQLPIISPQNDPPILTQVIEYYSKCATTNKEREYLHQLLGNRRLVTYLLYRGSDNGWYARDFHSRCDNKGPTISLFKVKDGDCIGGFTMIQWSSPKDYLFKCDKDAMLFNLSSCLHYPSKLTGTEISCKQDCGPCFTGGNLQGQLVAEEPFNKNGNCISRANKPAYNIPIDDKGLNMLTKSKSYEFTISELEVWEVKFL